MIWYRHPSVCCIVVDTCGPPGWVGIDLYSWLLAAWQLPIGLALHGHQPGCVHRRHVPIPCHTVSTNLGHLISVVIHSRADERLSGSRMRQHSWCLNPRSLSRVKYWPNWVNWLIHPHQQANRCNCGSPVLGGPGTPQFVCGYYFIASSPKGDGPARQDSWLAVGPVHMAGVPSELRVQSSCVWFSWNPWNPWKTSYSILPLPPYLAPFASTSPSSLD